jgi:hypothetical protein
MSGRCGEAERGGIRRAAQPGSAGAGWEKTSRMKARIKEENVFCGIRQRLARAKRADEWNGGMWKRRASTVKEEEGGQWGRVGQKGRMGRRAAGSEAEKNHFRIKIGFLNLPRLWKFAQGDLGGILTQGFFLNSSRLLNYF